MNWERVNSPRACVHQWRRKLEKDPDTREDNVHKEAPGSARSYLTTAQKLCPSGPVRQCQAASVISSWIRNWPSLFFSSPKTREKQRPKEPFSTVRTTASTLISGLLPGSCSLSFKGLFSVNSTSVFRRQPPRPISVTIPSPPVCLHEKTTVKLVWKRLSWRRAGGLTLPLLLLLARGTKRVPNLRALKHCEQAWQQ